MVCQFRINVSLYGSYRRGRNSNGAVCYLSTKTGVDLIFLIVLDLFKDQRSNTVRKIKYNPVFIDR